MEKTYNEACLNTAVLNYHTSPNILLKDHLRLDYMHDIRYDFACLYINSILRSHNISFSMDCSLQNSSQITLTPEFNCILQSEKIAVLHIQPINSNLNNYIISKKCLGLKISQFSLENFRYPTYIILALIKIWKDLKEKTVEIFPYLNLEKLTQDLCKDIRIFLMSKLKIPIVSLIQKLNHCKSLIDSVPEIKSTIFQHEILQKPLLVLISYTKTQSASISCEYSHTEDLEKICDFQVNKILERFPRFSAISITVTETPYKDPIKTVIDYSEVLESPIYFDKDKNSRKTSVVTPENSPKQSFFSIQQLREIMTEKEILNIFQASSTDRHRHANDSRIKTQSDLASSEDMANSNARIELKQLPCSCESCMII